MTISILESESQLKYIYYAVDRGEKMVDFFEKNISKLDNFYVLDAGCAMGGISIAFSKKCNKLIAIDVDRERLSIAKKRTLERNISNLIVKEGNILSTGFQDNLFDLVIINGVLEWVGMNEEGLNPQHLQLRLLKEAMRILKKDGYLYLAIENRWFPRNAFEDPHSKLPLVAVLPRRLADIFSRIIAKRPYQNYIYSYWGLKKLFLKTGILNFKFYLPLFDYQYPYVIIDSSDRKRLLKQVSNFPCRKIHSGQYLKYVCGTHPKLKRIYMKIVTALRLEKLFYPAFIVIAQKV